MKNQRKRTKEKEEKKQTGLMMQITYGIKTVCPRFRLTKTSQSG